MTHPNALWRENDKEIREEMDKSGKAREIKIPKYKKERNYLMRMNLPDARTWFTPPPGINK